MPVGRPPSCACGNCSKCRARIRARERYQALSFEERRAVVGRRDPEKVRANDRARYRRDPQKRGEVAGRWARRNPDLQGAALRRWNERNPEKRRAHNAVSNALRDGHLVRQPCEGCGAEQVEAHHDDYSRPLDVRWLCTTCHGVEHRKAA